MFDRRVETDAQDVIVAGELLAIYDRALDGKCRRGRNEYHLGSFPELLCDHLDAESADVLCKNDFKNSGLLKAG
jgi:hypothetical protein